MLLFRFSNTDAVLRDRPGTGGHGQQTATFVWAEKWARLGLVWAGRQRQRKSAPFFTPFAPSLRDVAVSLGCAQLVRRVVMTEHDMNILVPVGV